MFRCVWNDLFICLKVRRIPSYLPALDCCPEWGGAQGGRHSALGCTQRACGRCRAGVQALSRAGAALCLARPSPGSEQGGRCSVPSPPISVLLSCCPRHLPLPLPAALTALACNTQLKPLS